MIQKETVINEIDTIPQYLLGEVLDFIKYLKEKSIKENMEFSHIAESSFGKDWLTAEEDREWENL